MPEEIGVGRLYTSPSAHHQPRKKHIYINQLQKANKGHALCCPQSRERRRKGETTMIANRKALWMVVEGEVVLIHLNCSPAYFARVDRIEPDVKDGWWKLELLLLTLPVERLTWVIREEHMSGAQFMINEALIRIEQVPPIIFEEKQLVEERRGEMEPVRRTSKVISFSDWQRKRPCP